MTQIDLFGSFGPPPEVEEEGLDVVGLDLTPPSNHELIRRYKDQVDNEMDSPAGSLDWRNFPETHEQFRRGTATFRINEPGRKWCSYHAGTCDSVLTYEMSRREDFAYVRYAGLCWPAFLRIRARDWSGVKPLPDTWVDLTGDREKQFGGRYKYVRKWKVPVSVMYPGEQKMHDDRFCYFHNDICEDTPTAVRWAEDVVDGYSCKPICSAARAEIESKGWATENYG